MISVIAELPAERGDGSGLENSPPRARSSHLTGRYKQTLLDVEDSSPNTSVIAIPVTVTS